MIASKSQGQLLFVQGYIFLFRYFGFLSLVYFLLAAIIAGVPGILAPFSLFVEVLGIIELLWYLAWSLPYRIHLQKKTDYKPLPLTKPQRKALFRRSLEHTPDLELSLRKWLLNAHMEDVRRENVKDWLLWALFDREDRPEEDNAELEDYIADIEQILDVRIKPGRGNAEAMRLSFDPIVTTHRSLFYYMLIGFADIYTAISLLTMGFTFYRPSRSAFLTTFPFRFQTLFAREASAAPGMGYFHRPHMSKTHRPVVFVHGEGIGLTPYLPWIRSLPKDVGIIAVELLPISNRITTPMPDTNSLLTSFSLILKQQNDAFKDFVFVGNSYGTFMAAPLLNDRDLGPRINRLVLVDPVSLLLHLPDVAYNFTRRVPRFANEWQIWYAASTDPGIAHTLARRFCWRDAVLWREALQDDMRDRRTTVVLGGSDSIVNTMAVGSYSYFGDVNYSVSDVAEWRTTPERWNGAGEVELLWLDELDHGQIFFQPKMLRLLSGVVETYCRLDGSDNKEFYSQVYGGGEDPQDGAPTAY
ncbi:hypothetical protein GQ53DRAFT_696096 [Thozetella sp. PMI_491]|nr:hypothetical protein GQ53DRAFT_696096 [Thozetella sp. PMI_491]